MIILGIDPGLALIGFGIIEKNKNSIKVLDYGVIKTSKNSTLPQRLQIIYSSISSLIDTYKPDSVAVEELFYYSNQKSVMPVAHARGVCLLACANKVDGKLYEYTPLQIKQALTGNGRAEKHQVQYMVKAILNLSETPKPDDAADALAVAICHGQTNTILSNTDIK